MAKVCLRSWVPNRRLPKCRGQMNPDSGGALHGLKYWYGFVKLELNPGI